MGALQSGRLLLEYVAERNRTLGLRFQTVSLSKTGAGRDFLSRLVRATGGGFASPVYADGCVYLFTYMPSGDVYDAKTLERMGMSEEEALRFIARELFYTCVEMQRVCALFNDANDKFLLEGASEESKLILQRAFDIIKILRNTLELQSSINIHLQIVDAWVVVHA